MAEIKKRADILAFEQGLTKSRSEATALILAGRVYHGDVKIAKAGDQLPESAELRLKDKPHPWVSRGGVKLDHALAPGNIPVEGKICLDVGSSTGGFTDVLLHYGATKIYAVDVGTGQLDWKLRQDPRVIVMEKTNARHLTKDQIPDPIDIIVCDASFISLRTVLPASFELAKPEAYLIALIKPQFEAGREHVGKNGVVRDPEIHTMVCEDVREWLVQHHWHIIDLTQSPLLGPEGNKEFLIIAQRRPLELDNKPQSVPC